MHYICNQCFYQVVEGIKQDIQYYMYAQVCFYLEIVNTTNKTSNLAVFNRKKIVIYPCCNISSL